MGKETNMRIIVDAMSGDRAPDAQLCGACDASAKYPGHSFVLVGDREVFRERAKALGLDISAFEIVHTDTVITMEDDPMCVTRGKKDSSMSVGLRLLAEDKGDAFVSSGNTGALFTGAILIVRKIRGVQRPSIGAILPLANPTLLLDSGANLTVTDEQYEQFAVMGSSYMKYVMKLSDVRVGLLNNGTEAHKGTEAVIAANERLARCGEIHYVGNVEAGMATAGACDVLVSDGFNGNIFLKTVEGSGKLLLGELKKAFLSGMSGKVAALLMKKQLTALKCRFDAREHGGAPILGVKKPVIKAHGSSDRLAFANAIRQAISYAESGAIDAIAGSMAEFAARKNAEKTKESSEEQG